VRIERYNALRLVRDDLLELIRKTPGHSLDHFTRA
jgi:hypothetical protein